MSTVYGFLLDNGTARESQRRALVAAGCDVVWAHPSFSLDLISGLLKGDRFLVWRIDELELSIQDVVEMIARLAVQGVQFGALVDGVDTVTSSAVKDFCLILSTMRQKTHSKRVVTGIERARSAGQRVGRGRKLSPSDVDLIYDSICNGDISVREAARQFDVSRNTLQRYLSEIRTKRLINAK